MSLSYFAKDECHKNAKHGDLYIRAVCQICGEEYDQKIEEKKEKKDEIHK